MKTLFPYKQKYNDFKNSTTVLTKSTNTPQEIDLRFHKTIIRNTDTKRDMS